MQRLLPFLLMCLLGATPALAIPLDFTGTANTPIGDPVTWDDVNDAGTSGNLNGGQDATWDLQFLLDSSTQDLATVAIDLAFRSFDHNFTIFINGVEVVPFDPGNPAAFTPALNAPWNQHNTPWDSTTDTGTPRLRMMFTPTGVSFEGSTSNSSGLVPLTYAQPTVTPVFTNGANTIQINMVDDVGPDKSDWGITGVISLIPEPNTGMLILLGLGQLVVFRRGVRS